MDVIMKLIVAAYFGVITLITIYVIMKEKLALGCRKSISLEQFCDDNDSDYVKDTVPRDSDSPAQTLNRLKESGRSYEKIAVWRRSMILATVETLLVFLVMYKTLAKNDDFSLLIPIHIIFFSINYLHFNYQNFHMFRRIKDNVDKLIDKLSQTFK
jgi:hypothetical protein